MTPRPKTSEVAEDLTPAQLTWVERLHIAATSYERARGDFAQTIERAHDEGGLSYGVMGYKLGLRREQVYRIWKRWLDRGRK